MRKNSLCITDISCCGGITPPENPLPPRVLFPLFLTETGVRSGWTPLAPGTEKWISIFWATMSGKNPRAICIWNSGSLVWRSTVPLGLGCGRSVARASTSGASAFRMDGGSDRADFVCVKRWESRNYRSASRNCGISSETLTAGQKAQQNIKRWSTRRSSAFGTSGSMTSWSSFSSWYARPSCPKIFVPPK